MLVRTNIKTEFLGGVMRNMRKHLGIGLIPFVTGHPARLEILFNGNKRCILTIGHGADALNEKGMAGIQVNGVVGVLTA